MAERKRVSYSNFRALLTSLLPCFDLFSLFLLDQNEVSDVISIIDITV